MADCCIKTNVNLKEFPKCAADRVPLGVITKENGATITRMGMDGKMQTVEANAGDKLYKGDTLNTPANGSAQVTLADRSTLQIGPKNTIDISMFNMSPEEDGRKHGSMSAINGKPTSNTAGSVPFSSPSAVLGVRG